MKDRHVRWQNCQKSGPHVTKITKSFWGDERDKNHKGGHIFYNTILDARSNRGAKHETGARMLNGEAPPAGDGLGAVRETGGALKN